MIWQKWWINKVLIFIIIILYPFLPYLTNYKISDDEESSSNSIAMSVIIEEEKYTTTESGSGIKLKDENGFYYVF